MPPYSRPVPLLSTGMICQEFEMCMIAAESAGIKEEKHADCP